MAIDLNSLLQTFGTTGNRPTAQDFINLIVFLYNNGGGSGGGNVDVSQFVGFAQPSDANVTPVPAHRIFINNQNAPVAYNGYKDANGNALTPPANSMGIFFHTGTAWSMFVYTVTKESVGLGNVDNTSDADKPVSIAVQQIINLLQEQIDTVVPDFIKAITQGQIERWDSVGVIRGTAEGSLISSSLTHSCEHSNFFGEGAGVGTVAALYSNFFGHNAGYGATNAYHSNFFSENAGSGAVNAYGSNFFGPNAGSGATGATYSNFFGQSAGNGATGAGYSNFLGYNAGSGALWSSLSFLCGYQAGFTFQGNVIGNNNIIIGTNISLPNAAANAMNLGGVLYGTGFYGNVSGNPSIDAVAGGRIGIGVVLPRETLEVNGSVLSKYKELSADPTTTDIPDGYVMVVRNSTSGNVYLWANVGGAMVKAQLN